MKTTKIYNLVIGHLSLVVGVVMMLMPMSGWAISYPTYSNRSSMGSGQGLYQTATSHSGAIYQDMGQRRTSSFCSGDPRTEDMKQMHYSEKGIGAISTVPTIGEDGVAAVGGQGPQVRKGPGSGPGGDSGSSPGTPGGQLDPTTQQPIGDAVIPLLLMILAYAGVRIVRSRRMHRTQGV